MRAEMWLLAQARAPACMAARPCATQQHACGSAARCLLPPCRLCAACMRAHARPGPASAHALRGSLVLGMPSPSCRTPTHPPPSQRAHPPPCPTPPRHGHHVRFCLQGAMRLPAGQRRPQCRLPHARRAASCVAQEGAYPRLAGRLVGRRLADGRVRRQPAGVRGGGRWGAGAGVKGVALGS